MRGSGPWSFLLQRGSRAKGCHPFPPIPAEPASAPPRRSAERAGSIGEHDAELLQPALRVEPAATLAAYHLPVCAPPSTCSTSPVTWRDSVR